jgi:hypothetical protein
MTIKQNLLTAAVAIATIMAPAFASAAQLSSDAKSAIPKDIQQLIVVDYHAMQNSPAAMDLKDRVLPPELKRLETALKSSGLKVDQDADVLCFAAFREQAGQGTRIVGIAQGQFHTREIMANFTKNKVKPTVLRNTSIYPMGAGGMSVIFLNQTTMVFGDRDAVKASLDARDGVAPNFLQNGEMVSEMGQVDSKAVWSLLDQKGTQTMMKQLLGEAGSVADFESVRKRLTVSWYGMDFQHGVKFDLTIMTGDAFAAATVSSLLNAAVILRKMSGSDSEKAALADTDVSSSSGKLLVHFAASDTDFASLLRSPLFQSVVR